VRALASLADVKRVLHRDANDTSVDDGLSAALDAAQWLIRRYLRQDFTQTAQNTATVYDRPEDTKIPVPVDGATITQVRFYRTPSATAYVGKPMIDYEVQHDGLQPPMNPAVSAATSGGAFTAGTYYWVITAGNAAGETSPSAEVTATVVANGKATLSWQQYGGETYFNIYRVTASGTETSNTSCFVAQVAAQPGANVPGGLTSQTYTDLGAVTTAGAAPAYNQTFLEGPRWIRLHPTFFDVPFEGAVSMHFPDNWSRIEVDYIPPAQIPPPVREATALTAAAIYTRGPSTAAGLTMERMGDYMWTTRQMRGTDGGPDNEAIPEVAKGLLRPFKKRGMLTT
jgi:hypothetical protein